MPIDEYRAANLANWEDRVAIHTGPGGYETVSRLRNDAQAISHVVEFDRNILGDVDGLTLLHAMCHIGTDTLSFARLGATVTGFDFSKSALVAARDLAKNLAIEARFIEGELYDAPELIDELFDVVYTSVGVLCWLPDITGWANVVAGFVKPGGRFYIREMHPVVSALEERDDELLILKGPYFESEEPLRWDDATTYGGSGTVDNTVTYEWNHGMGEVINALIQAGLTVESVQEHTTMDWPALPHMQKDGNTYVLPEYQRNALPLMYSILASKPAA